MEPNNFNLLIEKAFILVDLVKNEEALKIFEDLNNFKGKKTIFFKLSLSMILIILKKYDKSLRLINEFIEEYPKSYIGFTAKSLFFLSINSFEKALDSINKAIKLKPDYILQYKIKTNVLINLKWLGEALYTIETALKLTPNNKELAKLKEFILKKQKSIDIKKWRLVNKNH